MEQVIIFDTTLRDGEQSLKASLSLKAKLQIAKALERLGVDYIEAGFPVSSPGDFKAVQEIGRQVKHSRICGLARAVPQDIEAVAEALNSCEAFRIHTFIATSPLHREKKLRMTLADVLERTKQSVQLARKFTDDVEFSCEDAGRTPLDELAKVVETAIRAGARTVNIPDTVGYTLPNEFAAMITYLRTNVTNIDQAILSVHCHDDLGLSVANSIQAVMAGARQVEATINGIGERAGNCALEEIAVILQTRRDQLPFRCNVNLKEIYHASQVVRQICNSPIQPNKAIVGENAFSHSSGIHQDGILKERQTYEIIQPEQLGIPKHHLHMTSRSGRHMIRYRLAELGYQEGDDYDLDAVYEKFLELADRKGTIFDHDLEVLLWSREISDDDGYTLEHLSVNTGSDSMPSATVQLARGSENFIAAAVGNGPIEAVFRAIDQISGRQLKLEDYRISSSGRGGDALGQVNMIAEYQGRKFHGAFASTDIIEASAQAYLNILNALFQTERFLPQDRDASTANHQAGPLPTHQSSLSAQES
ncbi:MAG: 2-isopropylmalate synthase [Oligoflexus sp.]